MSEFVYVSIRRRIPGGLGSSQMRDVHVRACLDRDEDQAWWASADVLYYECATTESSVLRRLREYPGCVVCTGATAAGQLVLAVRSGARVLILRGRPSAAPAADQCALIGSVVHALLSAGFTLEMARAPDKERSKTMSTYAPGNWARRSRTRASAVGSVTAKSSTAAS
jgi:hypothetical protein